MPALVSTCAAGNEAAPVFHELGRLDQERKASWWNHETRPAVAAATAMNSSNTATSNHTRRNTFARCARSNEDTFGAMTRSISCDARKYSTPCASQMHVFRESPLDNSNPAGHWGQRQKAPSLP